MLRLAASRFPAAVLPRLAARSLAQDASSASSIAAAVGVGKLNHVAIAVPDLEASTAMWRDVMGASVSAPLDLPEHGVTTVFVELDNTKFELLHPLGENSPIGKFLERNKAGGVHHVCCEVSNIAAALDVLKQRGIRALNPEPKIGAHNRPVVFLHPKDCDGVLVELEEV